MSEAQIHHPPPAFNRTRSTSSITTPDPSDPPRHHKPKQFVVSRHGGHNPRVPSFGRGLNKIGAKAAPGTSPSSESAGPRRRKVGAAFELGSPTGSTTDGGNSYKEDPPVAPPVTRTASSGGVRPGIPRNHSLVALTKSSSTRSLDRESRKHHVGRKGTSTDKLAAADRARSKSGDRRRQNEKRRAQSSDALTEMARGVEEEGSAAAQELLEEQQAQLQQQYHTQQYQQQQLQQQQYQAQQQLQQQLQQQQQYQAQQMQVQQYQQKQFIAGNNSSPLPPSPPQHHPDAQFTAPLTALTPPSHAPITPTQSFPSSQEPLTSRFIQDSPSSAADSTPLRRNASTYSITSATPSRTQQKLWLQRAHDTAQHYYNPSIPIVAHNPTPNNYTLQMAARAEKEFDRVAREFLNVQRFKDPVREAIERMRDLQGRKGGLVARQRPLTGDSSGAGQMGLSRSLQEGESRRGAGARMRAASTRDDMAVVNGGASASAVPLDIEKTLERMWRSEQLVSNE